MSAEIPTVRVQFIDGSGEIDLPRDMLGACLTIGSVRFDELSCVFFAQRQWSTYLRRMASALGECSPETEPAVTDGVSKRKQWEAVYETLRYTATLALRTGKGGYCGPGGWAYETARALLVEGAPDLCDRLDVDIANLVRTETQHAG